MTRQRPLRRLVAIGTALVASVALTACGGGASSSAGETHSGTVKVGIFPSLSSLAIRSDAAQQAFDKEGIKVELVTIATPADAAPQLIGGKLQLAMMDMTTPVLAASQGTPFTLVAPSTYGTPVEADGWGTANVWVKAGSPITSLKDLSGKTFGVPGLNSQIWLDVRTAVDAAGGDSSTIKWVETSSTGIDQVKAGTVDATTSSEPSGTAVENDPALQHLAGYPSAGGKLAFEYAATQKFAKDNPELVKKFESAILAANKEVNAQPVEARAATAKLLLPKAPEELLMKARYSKFQETAIAPEDVEFAIARMEKYGLIEKGKAPEASTLLMGSQ